MKTDRAIELKILEQDLDRCVNAKQEFTPLYRRTYGLVFHNDELAAKHLKVSRTVVRRWRTGLVIPNGTKAVLKFLRNQCREEIRQLYQLDRLC